MIQRKKTWPGNHIYFVHKSIEIMPISWETKPNIHTTNGLSKKGIIACWFWFHAVCPNLLAIFFPTQPPLHPPLNKFHTSQFSTIGNSFDYSLPCAKSSCWDRISGKLRSPDGRQVNRLIRGLIISLEIQQVLEKQYNLTKASCFLSWRS